MRRVVFAFLLTNVFAALILGQSQSAPEYRHNRCELWGEIFSPDGFGAEGMKIELASESAAHPQTTRVVNGAFDFQSVPPGIYHVRVIDRSCQPILRRTQSVKGIGDHIILYLPYSIAEPSLAEIVSLSELNHKIARQAQNAFRAGLKAEDAGELQKSIEDFKRALTIDPH